MAGAPEVEKLFELGEERGDAARDEAGDEAGQEEKKDAVLHGPRPEGRGGKGGWCGAGSR